MGGIVGVGECVIDFLPGVPDGGGSISYNAFPGGSVANLCVVAARMGCPSAFVGGVGDDFFGAFLRRALVDYGVDTAGMVALKECGTYLAFVNFGENHERSYSFANPPGADKMLRYEHVDHVRIAEAEVLHFSSNAPSTGDMRETQRRLLEDAARLGKVVSYDVNFRENNHASKAQALDVVRMPVGAAKVVKATEEELELVAGRPGADGAQWLLDHGAAMVLVTKGGNGIDFYSRHGGGNEAAREMRVVDTTGAGDCFLGGFLSAMLEGGGFADFTFRRLKDAVHFGNLVASVSITRWGSMTSVPTREEIDRLMD